MSNKTTQQSPYKRKDLEHADKQGKIGLVKHTNYWIRRDLETLKKSLINTLKLAPFVIVLLFILILFVSKRANNWYYINSAILTMYFAPIVLLGYFMIYIIVTKGYNIDRGRGTHISK